MHGQKDRKNQDLKLNVPGHISEESKINSGKGGIFKYSKWVPS